MFGVDLALGEGVQLNAVQASGERLRYERQRGEPCGPCKHETAWRAVAIQLGLDRVKQFRDMLVLVHEQRARSGHDQGRIVRCGLAHGRIVEVDHLSVVTFGEGAQQRRLADSTRPLQQQHRVLAHSLLRDVLDTSLNQCRHAGSNASPSNTTVKLQAFLP